MKSNCWNWETVPFPSLTGFKSFDSVMAKHFNERCDPRVEAIHERQTHKE